MSNILGIIIGTVVIIAGVYLLLFQWWSMFVGVFKGIVPILLIVIGAGVFVYFISEIKSKLEVGKEEAVASGEKKPQ